MTPTPASAKASEVFDPSPSNKKRSAGEGRSLPPLSVLLANGEARDGYFHFAGSIPLMNVVVIGSVTPLEVVPVRVKVLSRCKNAARLSRLSGVFPRYVT